MAHPATTPASYISPLPSKTSFTFVPGTEIYENVQLNNIDSFYAIRITRPNGDIAFEQGFTEDEKIITDTNAITPSKAKGYTEQSLMPGIYTAYYVFAYPTQGSFGQITHDKQNTATYQFLVIENRLPMKKWTATDVINRLFDICEPIRRGDKPRFRLQGMSEEGEIEDGSLADRLNEILSPEFSFTKETLRECLKQVGGVVHGEPRLDVKKDSAGKWYYECTYDLYGQTERWKYAHLPYVKKDVTQNVNSYATALDTHAENLINKQTNYSGVIVEPYRDGAKSMRTEQTFVQIMEDNMIFPTSHPVYTVESFKAVLADSGGLKRVELVDYLFERSVYTTQLSSYEDKYPYSKSYGLMYTQGEKDITGFTFKPENPVSPVFENYAILNILRRALGDEGYNIDDYETLCLEITYTPFYQARVEQTKPELDSKYPAALIYNQGENVIESRAYGENLKGVIARIGNAEKSYTYHLTRLSQIPKVGMEFDDDYVISAVYVEFLPTVINCTIALTKNFNRISQFIGISSVKRFSQISQTMSVERNSLWREYIVIGDEVSPDDTRITEAFLNAVRATFTQDTDMEPLNVVYAYGLTGDGARLPIVALPVVASSFGNSISFSWAYQDNFSAGAYAEHVTSGQVSAYYQTEYQYPDYYGRMYYYAFEIARTGPEVTASNLDELPLELPGISAIPRLTSCYISTMRGGINNQPYVYRKDNREKVQGNFQVDFVTNRKGLIIGSALAAYSPIVRGISFNTPARLYVFPERLNKFIDRVSGTLSIDLSDLPSAQITMTRAESGHITLSSTLPAAGKAWAIVTPQTSETTQVENEQGAEESQTIVNGGDVLLAQNMDFAAGDTFPTVYFTKKAEVYDKSVWKDRR